VDDNDLLAEQRAFYQVRAPEYDEWWQRRGRYDRGESKREEWDRQVAILDKSLARFGPRGDVLELAGGTGWWTERLARTADRLTVVDGSAETLALNAERVGRRDVEYEHADLFAWQPQRRYDAVFFSFWLSHVPRSRFGSFWAMVGSCLAPGGRVFLIDNRVDPVPGAAKDPYVVDQANDLQVRRLADGSEFRVVKVMYEPDELQRRIESEGWRAQVTGTRWFIFGSAAPLASASDALAG
jgi:demethylmenaquinone methyltransferase/2-methoxy-6-polyprenyl-1,4-benzoquinol methylase